MTDIFRFIFYNVLKGRRRRRRRRVGLGFRV
jgi:hypothetical protein